MKVWLHLFILIQSARCIIGCTDGSETNGFNIANTECQAPTAPTGLSVVARSSGSIDLVWDDKSDNEDGFIVERGSIGSDLLEIARLPSSSDPEVLFRNTGVTAGATYTYRVFAFTCDETRSDSSNTITEENLKQNTTAPVSPSNLEVGVVCSNRIFLSWTDSADTEDGFVIERANYPSGPFEVVTTVEPDRTGFNDGPLSLNTTYYYRVIAYSDEGASETSNIATATTALNESSSIADRFYRRRFSNGTDELPYRLYVPCDYDPSELYPIMLTLHGGGGRGTDNNSHITYHAEVARAWVTQRVEPSFVCSPQIQDGSWSTYADWSMDLLDSLAEEFSLDKSRYYVSGISLGGCGVLSIIDNQFNRIAAGIPMSFACSNKQARRFGKSASIRNAAIWNFFSQNDKVLPLEPARRFAISLLKTGKTVFFTHCQEADAKKDAQVSARTKE